MKLADLLVNVPPERLLWRDGDICVFTAQNLTRFVRRARRDVQKYSGERVALLAERDIDLAAMLLALDGQCEQLTILPSTSDVSLLRSVVDESASDVVLSARSSVLARKVGARTEECFRAFDIEGDLKNSPEDPAIGFSASESTPTRWVLPTSGTTGSPKLVSHTLASLARGVKSDTSRGTEFVWGSLYALGSFAGIQVFLQSWLAGSMLLMSDPQQSLTEKLQLFHRHGCNALSATPTMWRLLLMIDFIENLGLKRITLGGEIADQAILDGLQHRFPESRIVHIYASTEAGVGFSVRDGLEGFPIRFIPDPPAGVSIKVGHDGRLLLRPHESDQFYVNKRISLTDENGFVDSGDLVCRKGERYVFCGRSCGIINVGGRKVHPQEVESTLLKCKGVRMASVTAQRNVFTGSVVHAKIVVELGVSECPNSIATQAIDHCRASLEPHKVPAIIDIVDTIAVSSSGKIHRSAITG